jgi:hypothetical protein
MLANTNNKQQTITMTTMLADKKQQLSIIVSHQ